MEEMNARVMENEVMDETVEVDEAVDSGNAGALVAGIVGGFLAYAVIGGAKKLWGFAGAKLAERKAARKAGTDAVDVEYTEENRYDRVKYEEPIFGTGEDAEQVLDGLKTLISTYGNATAADLYELAGIYDFKYEMTRIGWTSVDGAEIVQTDDGYIITLPQPKPITYKEEP